VANNNSAVGNLFGIFNKLSFQQRMLIGAIVIVTFVLIGFVLFLFNQTNYSTLYSHLDTEDAAEIVDYLKSQKIPYQLANDGTTIKVPREKLYDIRLMLAGKGIPNSGIIGYEIFDKNNIGMSDFMQKLNYKRALEGELARTISEERGVKSARVQIVIPEKSVFKDEQKPPTASVVLKLSGGFELSDGNVKAIQHLVASSVEGLEPKNVTVVDTRGNLLSKRSDDAPLPYSESKQYEMKRTIESYLAHKAQSILETVLGYGSAIVKVNADLDFKRVEKTLESYDPDSQVAISEQVIKSLQGGKSVGDSSQSSTMNSITNYELSKTIEKIMEGAGNIKRITVAVVVNGTKKEVKEGDVTKTVFEPRTEEELNKLKTIVMQAVGYDQQRSDEISIVSIPFETQVNNDQQIVEASPFGNIEDISRLVTMVVAFLASMLLLKGLFKKLKTEKIEIAALGPGFVDNTISEFMPELASAGGTQLLGSGGASSGGVPKKSLAERKKALLEAEGDIEEEISEEALSKKVRREKIGNYVQKNPAEAAKLINAWLREEQY
jgi:flagellar M-ring protein FliF